MNEKKFDAIAQCFTSELGQAALVELKRSFMYGEDLFDKNNPQATAYNLGAAAVFIHIDKRIERWRNGQSA